jgi:ATP-binding cassette subfamily B protein
MRDGLAIYGRVLREARRYWPHLGGMLALSLLSTPLGLLQPVPLKLAIDSVIGSEPMPALLPGDGIAAVAVMVVVVALLVQLRNLGSSVLRTTTGQHFLLDFRARLFDHAQRLSLVYHDSRGTSDSTYRIQYDASAVKALATTGVIPFVSSTVKLVTMIAVTAAIDAQLAAVALVIAPLLFFTMRLASRRLRDGWHHVKRLDSSLMGIVNEVLGGVRVVKVFGREAHERVRYADHADVKARARIRLALLENGVSLVIAMVVAGGTAAVLWVGTAGVLDGRLTVGELTLVMAYLAQLYAPLERISEQIGEIQSALAGAERAFALLDEAPDVVERPGAVGLRRARGGLEIDGVSFHYPGGPLVLDGLDLRVPVGATVGIVGATGAGKTTLIGLAMRLYDPTTGRVLLDGRDVRDIRVADLRAQFAVVPQDALLFSASIAENIAYARPDARDDEIVAAARTAHAHEFIAALPDDYATLVGERGMRLSGGERQRIALARAILRDAPILILDEPTSAVDSGTEAAMVDGIRSATRGRTTLVIAHRPSTLVHCDVIIELAAGALHPTRSVHAGR